MAAKGQSVKKVGFKTSKTKRLFLKTEKNSKQRTELCRWITPHGGVALKKRCCGIDQRRQGKVNGKIANGTHGYKVQPTDEIFFNGKKLFVTRNMVYILPTSRKTILQPMDDPQGPERLYQTDWKSNVRKSLSHRQALIAILPVFYYLTNDGDLTKTSHPS